MMKQGASSSVWSTNGRLYSNTPLVRSTLINSSSLSVHPNNSCSNLVSPSHLSLKKIKPEPWQRLFEGKKQQEVSIKKNQLNINAMMNEDFIHLLNEHSLFDENSQSSFLPTPIQIHIDHLYEQIDDLTLLLSEERFKHKQAQMKAGEILSHQLENREKKFQKLLQEKLRDHESEMNDREKKYMRLLDEQKTQGFKREEQLRHELELLKKSFHVYKVNLDQENTEQLQIKINEALEAMKQEKEEEIKKRINDALIKERKHLNDKQKIEIENIRKQYQKETVTIQKPLPDTIVNQERLESLRKELTLTKRELDQTKENVINLSTRLQELEIQHIKTTQELNDCRMHFDEKTNQIEKLYAERVDQFY